MACVYECNEQHMIHVHACQPQKQAPLFSKHSPVCALSGLLTGSHLPCRCPVVVKTMEMYVAMLNIVPTMLSIVPTMFGVVPTMSRVVLEQCSRSLVFCDFVALDRQHSPSFTCEQHCRVTMHVCLLRACFVNRGNHHVPNLPSLALPPSLTGRRCSVCGGCRTTKGQRLHANYNHAKPQTPSHNVAVVEGTRLTPSYAQNEPWHGQAWPLEVDLGGAPNGKLICPLPPLRRCLLARRLRLGFAAWGEWALHRPRYPHPPRGCGAVCAFPVLASMKLAKSSKQP